ncbi:HupE/UreJ family protein [Ideonella margarita]|uniref:HupE/UreJ family protein n=1 Tax=Ideonella margarita TaxID=2984191 RepID=A0ABU9C4A2_9BURK
MTSSLSTSSTRLFVRAGAALCLGALPLLASAHGTDAAHAHTGFAEGLAHPYTGLDHLAAMLAVGLWSGSGASRRAWVAPLSFVGLMLAGVLLAAGGWALPAIEPMIATSLLALGLLLAARQQLPAPVAAALVGGFALFHGAAHGMELGDSAAAVTGMLLGTASLHLMGWLAGRSLQQRHGWVTRAAGLGVAVFGSALLLA